MGWTLEKVRRYVHYVSTETMIQGYVSSPLDRMSITKLNSRKIDRILDNEYRKNHNNNNR